jgi:hypothetical protein
MWAQISARLRHQSFALVRPFERFRHRVIVVVNEGQDFGDQFFHGGKVATLEQSASQDAEPNLDLVHPGSVPGCVMEYNAMAWVAQEFGACRHRLQDTAVPLDTQVGRDIRFVSYVAYQRFGLVNVEIIDHKVPTDGQKIALNSLLDVMEKVFFGPGVAIGRCHHPACSYLEVDDETLGAMTFVLEFLPFYISRPHGQGGMLAFQGLHPAQFIGTHNAFTHFSQFWCQAIQGVDIRHLLIELHIIDWSQPIANLVRFEIGLFLKDVSRGELRFDLQCLVS